MLSHPRAAKIKQRLPHAKVIECDHYSEVFNLKSQNFRIQKKSPQLIIAKKNNNLVLPTPEHFGIGGCHNYYFSHMLNCIYDCRYCFLQGMFASANYVVFANFEDFITAIEKVIRLHQPEPVYFFSGYDCDSLALDKLTGFLEFFIEFFQANKQAYLELRTKSINLATLMKQPALKNIIVASSFTPKLISAQVEHKVPDYAKRLNAYSKLAEAGWPIGIRLDPLIYADNFAELYTELIHDIFSHIDRKSIHSISIGPLRFPEKMYKRILKLYPDDKLLTHPLTKRDHQFSYTASIEQKMQHFVTNELCKYIESNSIFHCTPWLNSA